MKYTIIQTNDNNTVDVELSFDDYTVVASNVPMGSSEMDLENNITDQARTIRAELDKNLKTSQPYTPVLNEQKDLTL